MPFSGSSDVKLQRLWLLKGCVRYISSLIFFKEKAHLKLSTLEAYCRLQV